MLNTAFFKYLAILNTFLPLILSQHIELISPQSLQKRFTNSTINYTPITIDTIPYGQKLTGKLILATSFDSCAENPSTDGFPQDIESVLIVLAKAGNCSLLQKAEAAQKMGASLLIITYKEDENETVSEERQKNPEAPIPIIQISQKDANKLIKSPKKKTKSVKDDIILSIEFPAEKPKEKVRIDFFHKPLQANSTNFFKTFQTSYMNLKDNLDIIPHYIFDSYTEGFNAENISDCISSGRYCAKSEKDAITGRQIIMQALQEICIYKESVDKWWDYQLLFASCHENCAGDISTTLALDQDKINQCVNQSFTGSDPLVDDNLLLNEQKRQASSFDVKKFPSIYINENTLYDVSIRVIFSP